VDAIVFGSSIYYYQITGQSRVWLDPTFSMVGENFAPRHPGKKVITRFTQGNLDPKIGTEGIKYVTNIFELYGWKLEDSIHFCGTSDPDLETFEELSLRAFKVG
jgi:multimeric flavodoxin WrbA